MPSKMVRYKKDEAYLTTNKWPIRHMKDRRALCVYSDPLAGCGPCGRPPWQGNQFPIWGADGHKGRALQMADTTHERPKGPPCIFRSSCRVRPLAEISL